MPETVADAGGQATETEAAVPSASPRASGAVARVGGVTALLSAALCAAGLSTFTATRLLHVERVPDVAVVRLPMPVRPPRLAAVAAIEVLAPFSLSSSYPESLAPADGLVAFALAQPPAASAVAQASPGAGSQAAAAPAPSVQPAPSLPRPRLKRIAWLSDNVKEDDSSSGGFRVLGFRDREAAAPPVAAAASASVSPNSAEAASLAAAAWTMISKKLGNTLYSTTPNELLFGVAIEEAAKTGPVTYHGKKLSEAMLEGASKRGQAFGAFYSAGATCAMGAAYEAVTGNPGEVPADQPTSWGLVTGLVIRLNDAAHFTREKIAGLLAKYGM